MFYYVHEMLGGGGTSSLVKIKLAAKRLCTAIWGVFEEGKGLSELMISNNLSLVPKAVIGRQPVPTGRPPATL